MSEWPKPEERADAPVELPEAVQPQQPGDCIEGEAPYIIRNGDLSLNPNSLTFPSPEFFDPSFLQSNCLATSS